MKRCEDIVGVYVQVDIEVYPSEPWQRYVLVLEYRSSR